MDKSYTEQIKYRGRLIEIVHKTYKEMSAHKIFEIARRGPGTRIIFDSGDAILLTREYRFELDEYDWRIPGGKVFDTLEGYHKHRDQGADDVEVATATIIREAEEETGLKPKNVEYLQKSTCGATIEWDLHYFCCTEWSNNENGQDLEAGEDITTHWVAKDKVLNMAVSGEISEDRTALQLIRYIRLCTSG